MGTAGILNVTTRTAGKGNSKNLRNGRMVPAVIYGPKMENKNVTVEELFVVKHSGSRHESSIFDTKSDVSDLNSLKVMLKKIDKHPGSGRPTHVDLYALDMTARIKVNVPVHLVGESIGVKEEGGVLQLTLRDLEIECNPVDIPEHINVDITEVSVGSSIHVSDITFPPGIKPMTASDRTILTVNIPKEEKVEPAVIEGADGATSVDADTTEEKK